MYRYNFELSNCSRYLESLKHEAPDEPTDDTNTAYPPYLPNEDGDIEFPLLGGYHPASEESRAARRAVARAKKHEGECND